MKKALDLIVIYFLFLILGLLLGTTLYSIYLNVLAFVAGTDHRLFSLSEVIKAAIYIAYSLVFLICPMVSYYRVRHVGGFPQTVAYVIICLITWLLLFPGIYYIEKAYNNNFYKYESQPHLSQGYFRPGEEKTYFFTKDFESKGMNGYVTTSIVIDTTEDGDVTIESVKDDYNLELKNLAYPFSEVQVHNIFESKGFNVPVYFPAIIGAAKRSFSTGFLSYLPFLSIALLISILYGLSNFFEWRLLNTTLIFFITTIIIAFNSMYYSVSLMNLKEQLMSLGFFNMLSKSINDPIIFVLNNFITLVFVVIGIVKFAVKRHKNKEK